MQVGIDCKVEQIGDCTLYLGDCRDILSGIRTSSIDMIFTDPPYGHNNNNGDLISRREAALGRGSYVPERDNIPIANDGVKANEIFKNLLPEMFRILKPGSCCCCCCCCGGGGPDPQFARWALWMDEIFDFKQMIVWDKGPMGMGWHYRRSYETILVGQKPGAACKWHDTTDKVENIIRNIPKIIPQKKDHPTPKPVRLPEHFLRLHSLPGEVVLDLFMGGGSTGIASVNLQRKFIGIEIDPKYFDLTCKNIEAAYKQVPLFKETF